MVGIYNWAHFVDASTLNVTAPVYNSACPQMMITFARFSFSQSFLLETFEARACKWFLFVQERKIAV